ncbi:spermidine synthase [compost metagenome]
MFPAILENNRIWMTITPNEIETMKDAVAKAFGNVLTFGLGLGYYAYRISEKNQVERVTIVENNEDVIQLFTQYILPQFKNSQKIKIIKSDAFEYAQAHMSKGRYDFVFTDLWHDVSDGIDMYLRMKDYEQMNPSTEFMYWIEKSILCYL